MRRLFSTISLVAFVFLSAAWARAQSVRWEPSSGSLAVEQQTGLQLLFTNCKPTQAPAVPKVDRLELQETGQNASSMNIVNGEVTSVIALVYAARPLSKTPVTIPSFTVETDKGPLTVPAATFTVSTATVGQSALSINAVSHSQFAMAREVWAGEVFPITYNLNTLWRYFYDLGGPVEWNSAPLVLEEFSAPSSIEQIENGDKRRHVLMSTRGYIKDPGDVTLNAASQSVLLITGTSSFGFGVRPNYERYIITSSRPSITVKRLPVDAPASFNGAVGQFKLESKTVPTSVVVGEPITWTVTLSGTGNWPDIANLPSREVSKDFRVVQPQAKRSIKPNTLFDGTLSEDIVLVPTSPGNYDLGPFTWSYFDPAKGSYQTVTTDKVVVTVAAAPAPPSPLPTANSAVGQKGSNPGGTAGPPPLPEPPLALPGDPLTGHDTVLAPLKPATLIILSTAPFVPLLLLWLFLALRRARRTDPLRPLREARQRLSATLNELARAANDPLQTSALLQCWQQDTAILWQLPQAVPTPQAFKTAPASGETGSATTAWIALWAEAEASLYRDHAPLPSDWVSRAEAALAARSIQNFSAFQLFRPRNLLPFAAAIVLGFAASAIEIKAADGGAAYRTGDFPAAEQAWRAEIAARPTDWIARHNLALSLAQQNRWGEAAAHATAAFVQQPRNESVQRQLALTLQRAGYTSDLASTFARHSPRLWPARYLSPSNWQIAIASGATLIAIGLALLLLQIYGDGGHRYLRTICLCLGICGALAIGTGLFALHVYSPTYDTRVALVWRPATLRSIPTEVDSTQKTSPLSPGTLAVVDRAFIGWSRLRFKDGQTGWVRQEDLVHLWK